MLSIQEKDDVDNILATDKRCLSGRNGDLLKILKRLISWTCVLKHTLKYITDHPDTPSGEWADKLDNDALNSEFREKCKRERQTDIDTNITNTADETNMSLTATPMSGSVGNERTASLLVKEYIVTRIYTLTKLFYHLKIEIVKKIEPLNNDVAEVFENIDPSDVLDPDDDPDDDDDPDLYALIGLAVSAVSNIHPEKEEAVPVEKDLSALIGVAVSAISNIHLEKEEAVPVDETDTTPAATSVATAVMALQKPEEESDHEEEEEEEEDTDPNTDFLKVVATFALERLKHTIQPSPTTPTNDVSIVATAVTVVNAEKIIEPPPSPPSPPSPQPHVPIPSIAGVIATAVAAVQDIPHQVKSPDNTDLIKVIAQYAVERENRIIQIPNNPFGAIAAAVVAVASSQDIKPKPEPEPIQNHHPFGAIATAVASSQVIKPKPEPEPIHHQFGAIATAVVAVASSQVIKPEPIPIQNHHPFGAIATAVVEVDGHRIRPAETIPIHDPFGAIATAVVEVDGHRTRPAETIPNDNPFGAIATAVVAGNRTRPAEPIPNDNPIEAVATAVVAVASSQDIEPESKSEPKPNQHIFELLQKNKLYMFVNKTDKNIHFMVKQNNGNVGQFPDPTQNTNKLSFINTIITHHNKNAHNPKKIHIFIPKKHSKQSFQIGYSCNTINITQTVNPPHTPNDIIIIDPPYSQRLLAIMTARPLLV